MTQKQLDPDLIANVVQSVMASLGKGGETTTAAVADPAAGPASLVDAAKDYPLGARRTDLVKSASGLSLDDITLEKVNAGQIKFEDVKIRPETLEYQAQVAEGAGRAAVASNLRRAAEMTRIPDERVLEMYNALRPYRSTKEELLAMAAELENRYGAVICAAFVREACEVYEKRDRLKK